MTILSFGGRAHLGQMPVAETQSELSLRESGATSSHHSSAQEFAFVASTNATDRGDHPDHGDDGDGCEMDDDNFGGTWERTWVR